MFSRNLPYWGTIYIPYSDSLYLLRLRGVKQVNSNLFSIEEWDYLCDRVRYHSVTGKPRDLWRDVFNPKDPPAKVPPFKIKLKPNAEPYIAKARKYNEEEIRFLKLWNEILIAGGMRYLNNNSRWASRVLPVKKETKI